MFEGMESTLEESNCMLRTDPEDRHMVVENFVIREVTLWLLVGRNEPGTDL
jgi:argininosuccinate lyase